MCVTSRDHIPEFDGVAVTGDDDARPGSEAEGSDGSSGDEVCSADHKALLLLENYLGATARGLVSGAIFTSHAHPHCITVTQYASTATSATTPPTSPSD
ncbi:hypothetical protein HALA3H3_220023 [Halomonas sp. A3H3]|nr:hypothetical protein HALA3H3_220023 [Halomonas sp. A3H3]